MIFESLNSTGLDLTQSDLIRNYILMDLTINDQEKLYDKYWSPMEVNFKEDITKFDRFFRDYLTLKTLSIPNLSRIYPKFKEYTEDDFIFKKDMIEELAADLLKFSNLYAKMVFLKEEDKDLRDRFESLNQIEVRVAHPFLLSLYDDYENNIITKKEFLTILIYIESYVFRRSICGVPTNSLNKTFLMMIQEIKRKDIVESAGILLTKWKKYRRFPNDTEFKNELLIKDVYGFRNSKYLLDKLENNNRKENVNIDEYTIEHIMPQKEKLTNQWKEELGINWKEIHEKYLHVLGNLTITGYNSSLGYRPFLEKRDMEGGFRDAPFKINKMIRDIDTWNEQEINKRGEILADLAVEIWAYPEISEEVLEKNQAKEAEEADDEADIKTDYVSEEYWNKRASKKSLDIMNQFTELVFKIDQNLALTYNKYHVAIKTSKRNFIWFHPRMGNYNYIGIRFNADKVPFIRNKLIELNLLRSEENTEKYSILYLPLEERHLQDLKDDLKEVVNQAIIDSS